MESATREKEWWHEVWQALPFETRLACAAYVIQAVCRAIDWGGCSFRSFIYDFLGFSVESGAYVELLHAGGMDLVNFLADACEIVQTPESKERACMAGQEKLYEETWEKLSVDTRLACAAYVTEAICRAMYWEGCSFRMFVFKFLGFDARSTAYAELFRAGGMSLTDFIYTASKLAAEKTLKQSL